MCVNWMIWPDCRLQSVQPGADLAWLFRAIPHAMVLGMMTAEHEVETRGKAGVERPYRPGGWTLRKLVHHVADSHQQASGRLRMALTEDWPTIKPYDQTAWADLDDASKAPVELSLAI